MIVGSRPPDDLAGVPSPALAAGSARPGSITSRPTRRGGTACWSPTPRASTPCPIGEYVSGMVLRIHQPAATWAADQAAHRWPIGRRRRSSRSSAARPRSSPATARSVARSPASWRPLGRAHHRGQAAAGGPPRHARTGCPGPATRTARSPSGSSATPIWPRSSREADVLVLTMPLTDATRGIISREVIAALPERAWLINVARGALVDEPALLEALRAGRLAGAVLDVFGQEPLPADSPWWDAPNVIVTPARVGPHAPVLRRARHRERAALPGRRAAPQPGRSRARILGPREATMDGRPRRTGDAARARQRRADARRAETRVYHWEWGPGDARRPGLPWIGIFLLVFGGLLLLQQAFPQFEALGSIVVLAVGLAFLIKWAIDRGHRFALRRGDHHRPGRAGPAQRGRHRGNGLSTFSFGVAFLFIARGPCLLGRRLGLAALARRPARRWSAPSTSPARRSPATCCRSAWSSSACLLIVRGGLGRARSGARGERLEPKLLECLERRIARPPEQVVEPDVFGVQAVVDPRGSARSGRSARPAGRPSTPPRPRSSRSHRPAARPRRPRTSPNPAPAPAMRPRSARSGR